MSTFIPSQVRCVFNNSSFQKGEKECVAAYVVRFLAERNNDVFGEFKAQDFLKYMKEACPQNAHPIYYQMVSGPFVRGVIQALGEMVNSGHLVYRSDDNKVEYLSVGDKLMAFYSDYVPQTV